MTAISDDSVVSADTGVLTRIAVRAWYGPVVPVVIVTAAIVVIWYLAAIWLNAPFQRDTFERAGNDTYSVRELVNATWSQDRPVLPAPHQVAQEINKTVFQTKPTSPRSLVNHARVTLSSTLLGFLMGTILGIVLSVGIIHSRALDKSLMPWVITSQTIPILAVAPMIIVVLNSIGISGLIPKSIISAYLSFFPVTVGMVKGLRSPDPMHLDLMRTYNASRAQVFWKLRWPSALPFLFASMKVAIAISLVGAIVGELPTGAVEGLGARMLTGSYYGQTIQIWSALVVASVLAAVLVGIVGFADSRLRHAMGMER